MQPATPAGETAVTPLQRYLTNLGALYLADSELAAKIEAVPFEQLPRLEAARDGQPTVQLIADDGKPVYVHSRYRPAEEARQLIQTQMAPAVRKGDAEGEANAGAAEGEGEGEDIDRPSVVITGFGLGYHVAELEARYSRPLLIVVEDDLALIKAAMCVTDLAVPLGERRLTFLTSADKGAVHQRLRSAMAFLMLGLRFVTLPHTARYHAQFHRQMRGLLRDFVSYSRVQVYSLIRHARTTCRNVAFNLATYVAQPGVEVLRNRAAGYPGIVVAAGPSLARNVNQLGELRQRAVIIAVQTVFKTLLARKTPPHFVTSLDYHEISAQFFHGIADFGETILVAEPKAAWQVLDTFRGRTHVLQSTFADELLRGAAPVPAGLRAGSTVAHLAFYLAEHLGCNPIILVGQDLSFTDGLYYPPGMQIERIWQPELGRFNTLEMKQWERIVRSRAHLHTVKDVHGRDIYTDAQLFTYAEQFQSDFLNSTSRVIHATEGGMRLAGTEVLSLREAAAQFCTRPLPEGLFALPVEARPNLKACVCAALAQRQEELRAIRAIAAETLELLKKLESLLARPVEFNRVVARVDELRSRMLQNSRTYDLVGQVSQVAELRRIHADRAIRDEGEETPAIARRRLKRDHEYVTAFLEGCDYLLQMLPQALERVQERLP